MQHPDTDLSVAAMDLARDHSPPFLFEDGHAFLACGAPLRLSAITCSRSAGLSGLAVST